MKALYEEAKLEVMFLECEDIITASPAGAGEGNAQGGGNDLDAGNQQPTIP